MTSGAQLLMELRQIVGSGAVLTQSADIAPYISDWRNMFKGAPLCVVRPSTVTEVSRSVLLCRKFGAAIVPQGGNTGLAGGATPDQSGDQVILSLNRMTRIRELNSIDMTVEAEAGAIVQTVKEAAHEVDRLFPVSLASEGSATIGGILSTNAGGVNVLRYGMTRALTLGIEVVLADGTIVNGLRKLHKNNAGYDWKQMFIGAEGTVGIVTAAVMKLVPRPRHTVVSLLVVPDIDAAIWFYDHIQSAMGETLSAFELISKEALARVASHMDQQPPVTCSGEWCLLIEFSSSLPSLRECAEGALEHGFKTGWVVDGVVAESQQQSEHIWSLRERVTEAEAAAGPSVKHDISIPLQELPAFLQQATNRLKSIDPNASLNVFGHLGDGNLHFNVIPGQGTCGQTINRAVHDVVAEHKGSISAEHGLGQYRVDEFQRLINPTEYALVQRIKDALDPEYLMNPGKIISAKPQSGHDMSVGKKQ